MSLQRLKNPSAKKHSNWQVRGIASISVHAVVGGTAQVFEFREKGQSASYSYVFLGGGVGGSGKGGAGASNFETPHTFLYDTLRIVGNAFYEVGRQMAGGKPQKDTNTYYAGMMSFSDLQVITPFSAIDLNGAYGNLGEASASFMLGYGVSMIYAEKNGKVLFPLQPTAGDGVLGEGLVGGSAGVGAGGSINWGYWYQI